LPPLTLECHAKRCVNPGIYICFGITRVGFYKPGSRLPVRFRSIDTISASQNFPFYQDNASSPYVKESLSLLGSKFRKGELGLCQLLNVGIDFF